MKENIQIALCDDSDIERRIIRFLLDKYVEERGYSVQIEEFSSGDELLNGAVTDYDLIVLDIFMNGLNGIDTAKELLNRHPEGKVIFCSASNEFAEESYDVEALRYLVKPIDREKLFQTLDRFFRAFTTIQVLEYKYQRSIRRMLLQDVMWIEAAGRHAVIHTKTERIETNTTLAEFAERLLGTGFVKPIRYALVRLQAVAEVTNDALVLKDGTEIAISREKRKEIQEAFMHFLAL